MLSILFVLVDSSSLSVSINVEICIFFRKRSNNKHRETDSQQANKHKQMNKHKHMNRTKEELRNEISHPNPRLGQPASPRARQERATIQNCVLPGTQF